MKFSYDYTNGNSMMYITLEGNEKVDTTLWRQVLRYRQVPYLVPVNLKEGTSCFVYELTDVTNMLAWKDEASREDIQLMERKKERALRELGEYHISRDILLLEERYLYVNNYTEEICFICVPLASSSVFHTDSGHQDIPVQPNTGRDLIPDAPAIPDSPAGWNHSPDPVDDPWDLFKIPPSPEDEAPKKTDRPEEGKEPDDRDPDKTLLLVREGDEETVFLQKKPLKKATLTRLKTQEVFPVKQDTCLIGKQLARVDICVRNNPTVSRVHCKITYKDEEFYLEDNKSTNGTFLEGQSVQPEKVLKLFDGCHIRMSDEEFIFHEEKVQ